MKGSKGHQEQKQRKQTGFKELAHICVLCSAIASPSLLSSSPIRVNPSRHVGDLELSQIMGSLGDPAIPNTGGVGRRPKDMLDTYDLIPILWHTSVQVGHVPHLPQP